MKLKDYPCGTPTKSLKKAVMWLNYNRKRLEQTEFFDTFDHPDYWSMPKVISSRLLSAEVDWLQQEVSAWNLRRHEEDLQT